MARKLGIRAYPEVLRSIDSTTFTGSYQALGSVLLYPSLIIVLINDSTVPVTYSIDGTNDHGYVTANSFRLLDFNANASVSGNFLLAAQTQVYVKGAAGTGSVYLESWYQYEA